MKILKAGTVLQNKEICLVYNKDDKSYAFPKGHLEKDETLQECAIRETEEETGHTCSLINEKEIGILKYVTPAGEDVELHLYLAKDTGIVTRKINPKDKEETLWIDIEKVEEKILYQDLKELWLNMKNNINE